MRGNVQAESSVWVFKSPLQGAGAYCDGPTIGCIVCWICGSVWEQSVALLTKQL